MPALGWERGASPSSAKRAYMYSTSFQASSRAQTVANQIPNNWIICIRSTSAADVSAGTNSRQGALDMNDKAELAIAASVRNIQGNT
jgi:hypothetical protein